MLHSRLFQTVTTLSPKVFKNKLLLNVVISHALFSTVFFSMSQLPNVPANKIVTRQPQTTNSAPGLHSLHHKVNGLLLRECGK